MRTGDVVRILDDDVADLIRRLHLRRDQPEIELMVASQQARRIDQVGLIYRVQNVLHAHLGAQHLGGVRNDVKFRLLLRPAPEMLATPSSRLSRGLMS